MCTLPVPVRTVIPGRPSMTIESHPTDRTQDALRASHLYYLQDLTMEAIARELGTSRSSVSRLLSFARETGLVDIQIKSPLDQATVVSDALHRRFNVVAHVVPVPDQTTDVDRLDRVALSAARILTQFVDSNMVVGIAWGSTVSAISRYLVPKATHGSMVVQLNGAANTRTTGIVYASEILRRFGDAFGAQVQQFPVPAFFDDPDTKVALWRERSTKRVLELQESMDVVLFGIGAASALVPSHVYSGGYLERSDYESLVHSQQARVGARLRDDPTGSASGLRRRRHREGRRAARRAGREPDHRSHPRREHGAGTAGRLARDGLVAEFGRRRERVARPGVLQLGDTDGLALPRLDAPPAHRRADHDDDARVVERMGRMERRIEVLGSSAQPDPHRPRVRDQPDSRGVAVPLVRCRDRAVEALEEVVPVVRAGDRRAPVARAPPPDRRQVVAHRLLVGRALVVARLDLLDSVDDQSVEILRPRQRLGRERGAAEGRDVEAVEAHVGERCGEGLGLLAAEVGEAGARCGTREGPGDVRGGLAVADEEKSHRPIVGRVASCASGRPVRSPPQ
jgi:deoxyribonucleoside regulator